MTLKEIIKIFPAQKINDDISTSALIPIISHVEYESGICGNSKDYYFKIDLNNLVKSDLDDNTIREMAENGWVISKNKKYIEFIY